MPDNIWTELSTVMLLYSRSSKSMVKKAEKGRSETKRRHWTFREEILGNQLNRKNLKLARNKHKGADQISCFNNGYFFLARQAHP